MSGTAMADKDKLLRETEAMLRAVLISSPRGVRFEKLQRDYKEITFKTIPFKELGFQRLEQFINSIPAVARAEKGPDGDWVVKGVASQADNHVAKLISKQKKPKVRKSAKLMFSKRRITPMPRGINRTPVRRPFARPTAPVPRPIAPASRPIAPRHDYVLPPRMQRLQQTQNKAAPSAQPRSNVQSRKVVGRGELFKRATDAVRVTRTIINDDAPQLFSSSSKFQSKGTPKLSIRVTNEKRNVAIVTNRDKNVVVAASPERPVASGVLEDKASVKWIKSEILKAQSGLWATRLEILYKEKFKKVLPSSIMQELKFRPDIATMEEPIGGRFLLYAPRIHEPSVSDTTPGRHTPDFVIPCFLPEIGASIVVYVSHTDNLSCFYVSRHDSVSELLSEKLFKYYKSSKYSSDAIPSVWPGQIFCAQFTEDGSFYRACVLEVVDRKRIKVLYVDFGNKEVIPVERLRHLISEFQTQPIQAYECCLYGVQPADKGQEWSEDTINKFDELTSGKELRMTVHEVDDKTLSVTLVDVTSELDVGEEIIKSGLAVSTKNLESTPSSSSSSISSLSSSSGATVERSPLSPRTESVVSRYSRQKSKTPGVVEVPDEQFIDVLVCNITGTYNVYLRLVGEQSTKLESMTESMTSYYSDSTDQVTDPAVGDVFAMMSEEVWCRVKVIAVNEEKIRVFFVDHGDTAETSKTELRPLAMQFRHLPFQVFQCALNGLPKTKNPDVVDKLKKLIWGEVAVAEIVKRTSDLLFIDLLDTRTDANIVVNAVIRKLVIPDEELKPVLPKVGQTTDVTIAYISPTGSVFLHVFAAGSKRLEELNRDLTEHYSSKASKANEFISKPTAGKVCCAKSEDDGAWYRAKIVSVTDMKAVEVLYVDYGNMGVVPLTDLREPTQANSHVLSLPVQALECQLYDVPKDGWSDDLIDRIFDILDQGSVAAEVLSDGDQPSVSLLVTVESEDGQQTTHRLASLLGLDVNFDLQEDSDIETVSETDQENVNGEAGDENAEYGDEKVESGDEKVEDEAGASLGLVKEENKEISVVEEEAHAVNVQDETSARKDNSRDDNSEGKNVRLNHDGLNGGQAVQVNEGAEAVQANDVILKGAGQPNGKYKALSLPLTTGWIDVAITDVKDPDHFTFQLLESFPELSKLAVKLNDFYQSQVVENEVNLVEGDVYAVLYHEDECWYRGLVEGIMNRHESEKKAYVRYLDYGGYAMVDTEDVRVLDKQFLQLPFQGVQAKLAGVKCAKKKWPKQCIKDFKFQTLDQYFVAKVTSGHTEYNLDLSSEITVELWDTSDPRKDVLIAKKLIENNTEAVHDE